ncbi:olfactory receptor 1019-like [Bombina bombina]|uniref:olfactory receptor 1019-like n=1 Tax=Bombina bombina TaxID=8345 RepID=UPI00235A6413|nr:olfactory receptor 1019-like [Bombina bombina]
MISFNHPNVSEFKIQGFTDIPELKLPLFFLFLLFYLIIIFGNMVIFAAIFYESHLHTPMYLFLMNLSINDISLTSTVLPNMLQNLITRHKDISFAGCLVQMYIYTSLLCSEVLLLAAMAYDRYVAICQPLHYVLLMSLRHCAYFIVASWTIGFVTIAGYPILISKLPFCASYLINHVFCDLSPLIKLSCGPAFNVELLTYIEGTLVGFSCFLFILLSYICIISSILKLKSSEGRKKAFSTCASHLTCVTMYYGTIISLHMRPSSNYSPILDKYFSLINIILVPMLNPVIYSFKNQEVINALIKLKQIHI